MESNQRILALQASALTLRHLPVTALFYSFNLRCVNLKIVKMFRNFALQLSLSSGVFKIQLSIRMFESFQERTIKNPDQVWFNLVDAMAVGAIV